MRTKLTLLLEKEVIQDAKAFAIDNNTSISQLVSDFFSTINKIRFNDNADTPILNEISGVIKKNNKIRNIKKDYRNHLEKKYL